MKKLLAQLIASFRKQEGLDIQSLLFKKETFAEADQAKAWAEEHGFVVAEVEDADTMWRIPQFDDTKCEANSHEVWDLDDGVQADGCKVKVEEPAEGSVRHRSLPTGTSKFLAVQVKRSGINTAQRSVEGWASLETLDRHGELMLASAFRKHLDKYLANPVLCWCHNIMAPPIGHTEVEIVPEKGLRVKAFFASTAFAKEIFQLFKDRALRAFSVQFFPHEIRDANDEEKEKHGTKLQRTHTEAELYEISPVPVPAVAFALAGKAAKGLAMNPWEQMTLEMFGARKADGEPVDPPADPGSAPKKGARESLEEIAVHAEGIATLVADALAQDPADPDPDDQDPDDGGDPGDDSGPPTPEQEEELESFLNTLGDKIPTA